jgi:D-alanyl-D-alanine carboxypeptidase/D-alanyl-D-alanine-endopeptidase (penicillin-binding protein 4)
MSVSSFLAVLLNLFSPATKNLADTIPVINWHEASIFQLPTQSEPEVKTIVNQYLQNLARQGLSSSKQGIWIQSDWAILADNQGKIPAPAASITKIATTLAAIDKWGLAYRFLTKVYASGEVNNGVLDGDLVIVAGGDPLFVWEEAIAMGNRLQELGINKVTGDLLIVGDWQMNYKQDSFISAQLLREGLNSRNWSATVEEQYQTIKPPLPRPTVKIEGNTIIKAQLPQDAQLLFTHQSLSLEEILKLMNVYSNNEIAESLATQIGGGKKVAQVAAKLGIVPEAEIILINGSGLGVDNRISPRAACRMLIALERQLEDTGITIADLFPVAGFEQKGTIEDRHIPYGVPVKTGTLNTVSALAGVIPTQEREKVWFAIINYGSNIEGLRKQQDILLNNLANHWQFQALLPQSKTSSYFGDPNRNLLNN